MTADNTNLPGDEPDLETTYTTYQVESALVVWEWINDVTMKISPIYDEEWSELRSNVGSVEMRLASIKIGLWVDQVINAVSEKTGQNGYDTTFAKIGLDSFDFDIFPYILRNFLRDATGYPVIQETSFPDPSAVGAAIAAKILMVGK